MKLVLPAYFPSQPTLIFLSFITCLQNFNFPTSQPTNQPTISREEVALRNRSAYGFQEGEVSPNRVYNTFDKTYTSQIGKIPKITPLGAGYLKMTMTDTLKV